MHIRHLFRVGRPLLSLEVFPPRTPLGLEHLKDKLRDARAYRPDFVSVTYGAGGGTRETTNAISAYARRELGLEVMAHLTCVSHTPDQIRGLLEQHHAAGVDNIMALRGDPPRGETAFVPPPGGFRYAAELVRAIRALNHFGVGVAGYPEGHVEAPDYETDLAHQVEKIAAGADFIVSQFFLENRHYYRWRDDLRRAGVSVPVVAGILPAQSLEQITRFAAFCGVSVPEPLARELARWEGDPESAARAGIDHARRQVEDLLAHDVEGIHLYALNRLEPLAAIAPLVRGERAAAS